MSVPTSNSDSLLTRWTLPALLLIALAVPLAVGFLGGEALVCGDQYLLMMGLLAGEALILLALALLARFAPALLGPFAAPLKSEGGNLVGLLVLMLLPYFIAWFTDTPICERGRAFFWQSLLIDWMLLATVAMAYNLLYGFLGIVSFGHAAFFGIGAYMGGILTVHLGWSWPLAILVTLIAGVLIALFKGAVGLRIKGLYFALFTLAFAEVLFILSANRLMVAITGAEDGFTYPVPELLNATTNRLFFFYMVLAFFALSFTLIRLLMASPTGRAMNAIRDNETRAQALGFNTIIYKLIALSVSGLLTTAAGLLQGIANKGANPGVLGAGITIDALLNTILGGAGTFLGPVVGAIGVNLTEYALRDLTVTLFGVAINIGQYWALILGLIFVITVLAFPNGIVGTLRGWRFTRKSD